MLCIGGKFQRILLHVVRTAAKKSAISTILGGIIASFIFPCEFAIFSSYHTVDESQIQVCAQLRDLQKQCRCAMVTSDKFCSQTCLLIRSRQLAAAVFLKVPKMCTDPDLTLLYFFIFRTYSTFARKNARKNKMLALGVCFSQPCSSARRKSPAYRSRLDYCQPIGSFPQEQIRQTLKQGY